MIIRKKYRVESGHIVRNCNTERCKYSIHGHSYVVELLFESKKLDNAGMVVDFGLLKRDIKSFIDSFDHTFVFWGKDNKEYIEFIKKYSKRWIGMNVNPSAEMLSLVIFKFVDYIIKHTNFVNGEDFKLYSVIVHETDSGYAQCFREDLEIFDEEYMISISYSLDVINDWPQTLQDIILKGKVITNERPEIQVEV